jgi:hypothetical protein
VHRRREFPCAIISKMLMLAAMNSTPPDTASGSETPVLRGGFFIGTVVTLILALIPYTGVTVILPVIVGAWVTSKLSLSRALTPLSLKAVMKSSLGATISGMLASIIIFDTIWIFFDYQIGKDTTDAVSLYVGQALGGAQMRDAMADALEKAARQGYSLSAFVGQVLGAIIVCGLFGTVTTMIYFAIYKRSAKARQQRASSAPV